jgi:hypothetical protein
MKKIFYVTALVSLFLFTGCNNPGNTDSKTGNEKSKIENSLEHDTSNHQESSTTDNHDQSDYKDSHTPNGEPDSHTDVDNEVESH